MKTWLKSALFSVAALASASAANAAEERKFDAATFAAAQAAGRPVLIDVAAWWCPVCASQGRTIKAVTKGNPAYDKLLILRIDYDGQKAEWRKLGVLKQATLIGYHGTKEVGRVAFQTNKELIGNLLAATIK